MNHADPANEPKRVQFADVIPGDQLEFLSADVKYGRIIGASTRTGTVTAKTAKTLTVQCADGSTARLRADDWKVRSVHRSTTTGRIPYGPEYVVYRDYGHTVDVVWVSDPDLYAHPEKINELDRTVEVEVIATATRQYKSEGHEESGWAIQGGMRGGMGVYAVVPNKREMHEQLKAQIADYWDRG